MAIVARRRRRYIGDDPVTPAYVYDEAAAYSDTSPPPASSVPQPNPTTSADVATEIATFLDTGEWISVPNPGSTWSDVGQNIVTGQPTPAQMNLSAQAAAQQMAQAGGTPAQVKAAADEALRQMQLNPAPDAGSLGLSGSTWLAIGGIVFVLLIVAKKK